jgi:Spy/CpxP family protein refolding chaperone
MKPFSALPFSLLSLGLALSAGSLLADDTPPTPTPPPATAPAATTDTVPADGTEPTPTPAPPHHHHRPGFVLGELTQQLSLTPDQQKQVAAILKSDHEQMKTLRGDDSIAPDDKRAQAKAIMSSTRSQIRALLTPEQQKIFDALPAHGERPPAPTPAPTT